MESLQVNVLGLGSPGRVFRRVLLVKGRCQGLGWPFRVHGNSCGGVLDVQVMQARAEAGGTETGEMSLALLGPSHRAFHESAQSFSPLFASLPFIFHHCNQSEM